MARAPGLIAITLSLLAGAGCGTTSMQVEPGEITVETWNIRNDNPGDGVHAWPHREDAVIAYLRDSGADVVGLQEVLPHQLAAIRSGLDTHDCFSRSRERDPGRGEAVPILWRSDRWGHDPEHATHFWLSERPGVPGSMSWNTACTRMVTMIRLLPVGEAGVRTPIWVANLHLDHRSAEARAKGAALVRARIASRPESMRREPVIVLGDFNATPGSPPVETLLAPGDDGSFIDAWSTIEDRPADAPRGTWNGWKADARDRRIDHVLFRGLALQESDIGRPTGAAGPLSDHWPVRATLRFVPEVDSGSE